MVNPEEQTYSNIPQGIGVPVGGSSWAAQSDTLIKDVLDTHSLLERVKCRLMNIVWDKVTKDYVSITVFDPETKEKVPLSPLINFRGLNNALIGIETACDKFVSLSDFNPIEISRKAEEFAVRIAIDIGLNMREFEVDPHNYDAIVDSLDELYHAALKKAHNALTLKGIFQNVNVNVQKMEGEENKQNYWAGGKRL